MTKGKVLLSVAFQNMIYQLQSCGIVNSAVLKAFQDIDRSTFVSKEIGALAFSADWEVPLIHAQHMLTPMLEAQILQAAEISSADIVFVGGTGSGYLTALLSQMAQFVYTIENDPDLLAQAEIRLRKYGNLSWELGDFFQKDLHSLTFDVIILAGALDSVPSHFFSCLTPDTGRLLSIEYLPGEEKVMYLKRYRMSLGVLQPAELIITAHAVPFRRG